MSDVVPNYTLEIQGLTLEKAQLELNIQSQQFRIAQTQDEVRRIEINITATRTAISALVEKIKNLRGN